MRGFAARGSRGNRDTGRSLPVIAERGVDIVLGQPRRIKRAVRNSSDAPFDLLASTNSRSLFTSSGSITTASQPRLYSR